MQKTLIITVLITLFAGAAFGQKNLLPRVPMTNSLAGGGGPDVWYDVDTLGNSDTDGFGAVGAQEWVSVTVLQAGTATKARIYIGNSSGTGNLKAALYPAAGGSPLASGTGTFANTQNGYSEITFSSQVSVSATTYILSWATDSGGAIFRYKASTGNWKANTSVAFGSFPADPLPAHDFSLSRSYVVSLYVD